MADERPWEKYLKSKPTDTAAVGAVPTTASTLPAEDRPWEKYLRSVAPLVESPKVPAHKATPLPTMGTVAALIAQQRPEVVRPGTLGPGPEPYVARFLQGATAGLVKPETLGITQEPATTGQKVGAAAAEFAGWALPIGALAKATAPIATAVRGVQALGRAAPAVGRMAQWGTAGALAAVPEQARELSAGKPVGEAAKEIGEQAAIWAGMEAAGLVLSPLLGRIRVRRTAAKAAEPKAPPLEPRKMLALPSGARYEAGYEAVPLLRRFRPETGTQRFSGIMETIRPEIERQVYRGAELTVGPKGLTQQVAESLGYDLEREFQLAAMPTGERLRALAENNRWVKRLGLDRPTVEQAFVRPRQPVAETAQLTTPGVQRIAQPGTPEWEAAVLRTPENQVKAAAEAVRVAGSVAQHATAPSPPKVVAATYRSAEEKSEFWRRALSSVEGWLRSKGEPGQRMVTMAREVERIADQQVERWTRDMLAKVTKLTPAERLNMRAVVRGEAQPLNQKVADAANAVRVYYAERPVRVQQAGLTLRTKDGQDIPFMGRENHFPLRLDWRKLSKQREYDNALEYLVKTGQAKDLAEADRLLSILRRTPLERHATFQHEAERVRLPQYELDPLVALRSDLNEAENRIAQALVYGPKDEKLLEAIGRMHQDDQGYATLIAERLRGLDRASARERSFIEALLTINVLSKLGLAAIPNAIQTVNAALKLGVNQLVRGIRSAFANKQEAIEFAQRAGVHLDPQNMARAIAEARGDVGASLTSGFMRATGFNTTEFWNRLITSQAAKGWAEDMFQALKQPGSVSWIKRRVAALGMKPERIRRLFAEAGVDVDAALRRGALSEDDMYRIVRWVVQRTQFPASKLDVPLWASSPWGRVVFQFKRYAYNQGRLLKSELWDEAARYFRTGGKDGSLRAWGPFLILFPSAGWVIGAIRDWISGKETPREKLGRIAETAQEEGALRALVEEMAHAYTWVGGLGILTDTVQQLQYGGWAKTALGLAGPSVSTGAEIVLGTAEQAVRAGQKTAVGEPPGAAETIRGVAKPFIRQFPIVGRPAAKGELPFGVESETLKALFAPEKKKKLRSDWLPK